MSRTLFENSKAALAFAALTIFGAVSMVGTSDNGGVLSAVVERFGAQPAGQAGAESSGDSNQGASNAPAAPPTVFGDYSGTKPAGTAPTGPSASPPAEDVINPMTAPISPTAIAN